MSIGPQRVLTVPGRYEQVKTICDFVSDGAREAGLDDDAVFHVELCCDEASTNIIEHAYGAEDAGDITVAYEYDELAFTVRLQDNGRSFDPANVPPPPLPSVMDNAPPPEEIVDSLQVGGLGIHFIRNLMDEVRYEFSPSGNTLIMVKNIPPEIDEP